MAERTPTRPVRLASFLLSLSGLAVSIYLTVMHYLDPASLACSDSGTINCTKVTTSAQSAVFGVPVALLGLLFFVGIAVLCTPPLWRTGRRWVTALRAAMVISGMVFVLWLVAAELLIIKAICLWCTSVHLITFALFALVVSTLPACLARDEGD